MTQKTFHTLERPKDAFKRLGIGSTTGWKLIRLGVLETVKIGSATRITTESINHVAENGATFPKDAA